MFVRMCLQSTSGLMGAMNANLHKDGRETNLSISEILRRRVSNPKSGGNMLPPVAADARTHGLFSASFPNILGTSQVTPNLSISLGPGELTLTSHDEALLARARASHDSQHLSRSHNKIGGSFGVLSQQQVGTGGTTGIQGVEASVAPGEGEGQLSSTNMRLLSGAHDMTGMQSTSRRDSAERRLYAGEDDDRHQQDSEVEHWTEDELDALCIGTQNAEGIDDFVLIIMNLLFYVHVIGTIRRSVTCLVWKHLNHFS